MSDKPELTVEREMLLRALVDNGVALAEDQPGQLFSEIDRLRAENLRLKEELNSLTVRSEVYTANATAAGQFITGLGYTGELSESAGAAFRCGDVPGLPEGLRIARLDKYDPSMPLIFVARLEPKRRTDHGYIADPTYTGPGCAVCGRLESDHVIAETKQNVET